MDIENLLWEADGRPLPSSFPECGWGLALLYMGTVYSRASPLAGVRYVLPCNLYYLTTRFCEWSLFHATTSIPLWNVLFSIVCHATLLSIVFLNKLCQCCKYAIVEHFFW